MPMEMATKTYSAETEKNKIASPQNGTLKTNFPTASDISTLPMSRKNKGITLAKMTSAALAGVMTSCSRVPESFSRIRVEVETSDPVKFSTRPITPGIKNQALSNPGL